MEILTPRDCRTAWQVIPNHLPCHPYNGIFKAAGLLYPSFHPAWVGLQQLVRPGCRWLAPQDASLMEAKCRALCNAYTAIGQAKHQCACRGAPAVHDHNVIGLLIA